MRQRPAGACRNTTAAMQLGAEVGEPVSGSLKISGSQPHLVVHAGGGCAAKVKNIAGKHAADDGVPAVALQAVREASSSRWEEQLFQGGAPWLWRAHWHWSTAATYTSPCMQQHSPCIPGLHSPQSPPALPPNTACPACPAHLLRVLVQLSAHIGQQLQRACILPRLDGQEDVGEACRNQCVLSA